jgi:hypothetical protein
LFLAWLIKGGIFFILRRKANFFQSEALKKIKRLNLQTIASLENYLRGLQRGDAPLLEVWRQSLQEEKLLDN